MATIRNEHRRQVQATPEEVGRLIDGLAGPQDRLWPVEDWPRMRFDRPLAVGARGGHGPIRYDVASYTSGEEVRFRFTAPAGFDGHHGYAVVARPGGEATLHHALVMRTTGRALLSWPLLYRPLHDALIEDSLDRACHSLGLPVPRPARWTWRVRLLRALVAGVARGPGPARRGRGGYDPTDARRR